MLVTLSLSAVFSLFVLIRHRAQERKLNELAVPKENLQSTGGKRPQKSVRSISPAQAVTASKMDPKSAPLSVRAIVDIEVNVAQRLVRIHSLSKTLKKEELSALYNFLSETHEEDKDQRGHVIKNDLLDALCGQTQTPKDLGNLLGDLYHDQSQNVVIRDYAIQHVAALYERLDDSSWAEPEIKTQRGELQNLLWQAVDETDSSIGGTALLALSRLSERHGEIDEPRIETEALAMAQDTSTGELSRMTAFQVCGRAHLQAAIPLLVDEAKSESDVSLRISAIGSLGLVGQRSEVALLQNIVQEGNPRFKPSALLALKRVQSRIGQP
jgi:hypothetical protein